jgi:hypothetical protein
MSTKVEPKDTSEKYYERYNGMPMQPIMEQMEVFNAGAVSIGVEFRVLNDALTEAMGVKEIAAANGYPTLDDHGVSLHLFVKTAEGNFERLRFDCFNNDPHYHYFSIKGKWQDVLHIDRNVTGDPLAWAMTMIRTRLQPMLERADVPNAGQYIEPARIEQTLSKVAEAAYRARYSSDRKTTEEIAKTKGKRLWETHDDRSWATHSSI